MNGPAPNRRNFLVLLVRNGLSHIISMAKEVMAQDTTSMSMAFHSSLRYDPGCRITP